MPTFEVNPVAASEALSQNAHLWRNRVAVFLLIALPILSGAYFARRALQLQVARISLSRDPAVLKQEREDGIAIRFTASSPALTAPLSNEMNEIWEPAHVRGINYYTFAGPSHWFQSFVERSNRYRSHSDLSDSPHNPLARLLGMPPKSSWPSNVAAFHNVMLDGYLAYRFDAERKVAVILYEVSASYEAQPGVSAEARRAVGDELLRIMKSAKVEPIHN